MAAVGLHEAFMELMERMASMELLDHLVRKGHKEALGQKELKAVKAV